MSVSSYLDCISNHESTWSRVRLRHNWFKIRYCYKLYINVHVRTEHIMTMCFLQFCLIVHKLELENNSLPFYYRISLHTSIVPIRPFASRSSQQKTNRLIRVQSQLLPPFHSILYNNNHPLLFSFCAPRRNF